MGEGCVGGGERAARFVLPTKRVLGLKEGGVGGMGVGYSILGREREKEEEERASSPIPQPLWFSMNVQ